MPHSTGQVSQRLQSGTFDFTSSYLKQQGAVFARHQNRDPVLRVDFGGNHATVPLATVASAADLAEGHPDIALLRTVGPALLYREEIVAGDGIPTELADGRPSWPVSPKIAHRVEQRILEILWARSTGRDTVPAEDAPELIARQLVGVDTRRNSQIVDRIRDHIDAASRAVQLRDDVTGCQRMVGDLATLATQRDAFAEQDRLRDTALKLRNVMVWATKRTMHLDMLTNDIKGSLVEEDRLPCRIWPAINELRAWTLDLAPVRRAWDATGRSTKDMRIGDIEKLHRLVSIRFSNFTPSIYRPSVDAVPVEHDAKGGPRGHGE